MLGVCFVLIERSILVNYLGVDVADSESWVFRWLRIYHIICRYFVVVWY